jgi:hypothetical protein
MSLLKLYEDRLLCFIDISDACKFLKEAPSGIAEPDLFISFCFKPESGDLVEKVEIPNEFDAVRGVGTVSRKMLAKWKHFIENK